MATTEPRVTVPRRTMALSSTADQRVVPTARRRLAPLLSDDDRARGWAATLAVTALAAFLRFWRLGTPHTFQFDETYYAKHAYSLLHHGYVLGFTDKADRRILNGRLTGIFTDTPQMIVHPEVGKWLIASGEWAFGMDPFGWRVASALAGSLMVMVMVRLARRLTGSTLLGVTAGLLLCFDGLQLVLSRLALLDIFVALFLLSAVSCLVADRDWGRLRIAALTGTDSPPAYDGWGPVRGLRFRPWRLAAGILFGLAIATKWSALAPLAAFGLWTVWQDAGARRMLGVRRWLLRAVVVDGLAAFGYLVVVAAFVYLLSWTGWLFHAHDYELAFAHTQYGDYWGDYSKTAPHGFWDSLTQGLRSLYHYHLAVFEFHEHGLDTATHIYQSDPTGWPLLNRPVGTAIELNIKPGQQGCEAAAGSTCLRQVLLLGTPALWWGGAVAMVYAAYSFLARRDWRFGIAVIGFASAWLPWWREADRPIFLYYAVCMLPFTVLAITLTLGRLLGGATASYTRRAWGTAVAGAFVLLVVVNFAWFWPIWTDGLLTNSEWDDRIWFAHWI